MNRLRCLLRGKGAKVPAFIVLAISLLCGCQPPSTARAAGFVTTPTATLPHAFAELFENANPSTRMNAYFLSVGVPETPELARILCRRSADADPVERVVAMYALAAMTRAPGDIDAFLNAFPTESQLFFDLMETEWELSGTFNTGLADFLLLLAHEPRTRQKALPHLARIVRNMPGELESMGTYWKDPLVRAYIDEHGEDAKLDDTVWNKDLASPVKRTGDCAEKIAFLIRHGDTAVKAAAILVTERMWLPQELLEIRQNFTMDVPEGTAGTLGYELPLLRHLLDFDAKSLCKLLSSGPDGIAHLLDMEKRLYRPPLQGIAGTLWYELSLDDALRAQRRVDGENAVQGGHGFDDTNRARLLKILDAVMLYGKDRLEACEIDRLMPYMREIRPADRPAGVSSATEMKGP